VVECVPCPVFASFTLAFALQLRKNYGRTSVRVIDIDISHISMYTICSVINGPSDLDPQVIKLENILTQNKLKGKAIPLWAWTVPEGSRRLRPPDFKTIGT
jgi:hypothetical protein